MHINYEDTMTLKTLWRTSIKNKRAFLNVVLLIVSSDNYCRKFLTTFNSLGAVHNMTINLKPYFTPQQNLDQYCDPSQQSIVGFSILYQKNQFLWLQSIVSLCFYQDDVRYLASNISTNQCKKFVDHQFYVID